MSIVEVMFSVLLVSMVLIGATNMLGAVVRDRTITADNARGQLLAQQLAAEILATDYRDAVAPVFGPESGESTGNRSQFDDVDDFHNWSALPIQNRSGSASGNSAGWQHSVTIELVTAANPSTTTAVDEGVKRITVTIRRNRQTVAKLVTLRSDKYVP